MKENITSKSVMKKEMEDRANSYHREADPAPL